MTTTLPSASTSVEDQSGSFADSSEACIVFACCEQNADLTPRVFASAAALLAQHGYSPGVDYVATHIEETGESVTFVGLPTATAGALGRQNSVGVLGTSVISVAAGAAGYLEETDCSLVVQSAGTIGANGITFLFSADGGLTEKLVRLKTNTSYTVPYLGIVISFAAGTLLVGDRYTFTTTAPMWDGSGIADAGDALADQQKLGRTWMVIGDVETDTFAGYVVTAANAYASSNDRFTLARIGLRDRLPLAEMARVTVRMSGAPTITFAEVGATADTITRSAGSFIADGFAVGMVVTVAGAVAGSGHNNITGKVTVVTALVLTLDTADLDAEGPIAGVTIVGSHGLIFAATTATRSGGSWLDDGFRVGDSVTFALTASNNITVTITVLTATVMTFAAGGSAETIGTRTATCIKGETESAHLSAMDAEMADIDDEKRIDIGFGRARKVSTITGWDLRRPAHWHISVREYQHDVHIPTWRKSDGPLSGVSLKDADGNRAEFDERTVGGALAARFSCLRTWGNGPNGTFVAQSLTRASGGLLSRTHNMHVANVMCSVVQKETENAVGQVLVLKADGTATDASLTKLEGRVNSALQIALLQDKGEGPRASIATWSASRTDILSVPDASLTGVGTLKLNGTLEHIATSVKVT
jgi:hypothetical protein